MVFPIRDFRHRGTEAMQIKPDDLWVAGDSLRLAAPWLSTKPRPHCLTCPCHAANTTGIHCCYLYLIVFLVTDAVIFLALIYNN
jgi:hypothetical protein